MTAKELKKYSIQLYLVFFWGWMQAILFLGALLSQYLGYIPNYVYIAAGLFYMNGLMLMAIRPFQIVRLLQVLHTNEEYSKEIHRFPPMDNFKTEE